MTGLIIAWLGVALSSIESPVDDIVASTEIMVAMIEQERKDLEAKKEQDIILQEIFIEQFILWLDSLKKIKYRLGMFDIEENKFDCVGLFKAYAVSRGLLTKEEAGYINSTVMYLLSTPKRLSQAKRGDITYWSPIGDEKLKHIAIVTRDYDPKDGGIWIIDNAPGNGGKIEERFLKMRGDVFVGRWKIKIGSNPFIDIANNKGLEYKDIWEYQGYFAMSRYYAPQPGQETYLPYAPTNTYAEARDMNCGRPKEYDLTTDTCANMAHKKTQYTDINKVVACPIEFGKGQIIKIVDDIGYERLVKCMDRGGSIKGKRLDLFAGIGTEGLENIKYNRVPGGSQHVYKFISIPKPINESNKTLRVINSNGDFVYSTIRR